MSVAVPPVKMARPVTIRSTTMSVGVHQDTQEHIVRLVSLSLFLTAFKGQRSILYLFY